MRKDSVQFEQALLERDRVRQWFCSSGSCPSLMTTDHSKLATSQNIGFRYFQNSNL